MKVQYAEYEGAHFQEGEIALSVRQVVRRLKRATKTRMHHKQRFTSRQWYLDLYTDIDGRHIDLLPPLSTKIGLNGFVKIHILKLPDDLIWDAVNGWRQHR